MKNKKDFGVIIQFDDKEYSEEEIEFLWERFISILAEAKNIEIKLCLDFQASQKRCNLTRLINAFGH